MKTEAKIENCERTIPFKQIKGRISFKSEDSVSEITLSEQEFEEFALKIAVKYQRLLKERMFRKDFQNLERERTFEVCIDLIGGVLKQRIQTTEKDYNLISKMALNNAPQGSWVYKVEVLED
jgi:predicted transport protein